MNTATLVLFTGTGATAFIDLWALARRALFGTKLPDYGLVGRWVAGLWQGQFRHESIAKSPRRRGERVVGWTTHYLTGIAFAALLPMVGGAAWFERPSILPALGLGVATVAAPFLILQPGTGAGIAASRTPRPGAARLQSLVNHAFFGLGLFLSAAALQLF
jgi:hypothetical protein